GLQSLQTAVQLDPGYSDAMAYINLLLRIEAGVVDDSARSAELIAQADDWVQKALNAKRQQAAGGIAPAAQALVRPPPPPPPPPAPGTVQGAIHVDAAGVQPRLVSQTPPVYPALARQARISGTVRLQIQIGKDGAVQDIRSESGHPLLIPAAMLAVWKWKY